MQQGDYSPYFNPYPQNPNPNPNPIRNPDPIPSDLHHTSYASAPPFNYAPTADYAGYNPPYPQNPDHLPPTAPPSYNSLPQQPPIQSPAPVTAPGANSYPNYNQPPPSQPPVSNYATPYDSQGSYQQSTPNQPYYQPPFDQHQTEPSFGHHAPVPPYSSLYSAPGGSGGHGGSSVRPVFDTPYENNPMKYDGGAYFDDKYGENNANRSEFGGSDLYGNRSGSGGYSQYDDGVYKYEGSKVQPYGARGTAPKLANSTLFDDYGRSISSSSGREPSMSSAKIVRAVPKADTQQDGKSGVQKYRVKLLAESGGQSTMDVLCQVGLDGIRMLDPSTSRILRIYPLENVTRCEVFDSSTLAFWSKSSVDIEPRRIRLQSNSYTTNTLLDIVTAATVQLKEMGGTSRPADMTKATEQSGDKKKGFPDWINLIKPANEEKDHWVPDEVVTKCTACGGDFGAFNRKHHCRNCGDIFCDKCTHGRTALTAEENAPVVRVCDRCLAEVTQRLTNAKETASRPAGLKSHEDLAKKLQEEMERNRKSSSGSRSDVISGKRMKEVACPICTVHLQVQVPTSGSETIECGVCQHPFLVSAH